MTKETDMTKEQRKRDQALRRALRVCPGRDTIEDLRAIAIMLAEQGDAEGARAQGRAVETLELLRVAAHGGELERPMPRG